METDSGQRGGATGKRIKKVKRKGITLRSRGWPKWEAKSASKGIGCQCRCEGSRCVFYWDVSSQSAMLRSGIAVSGRGKTSGRHMR